METGVNELRTGIRCLDHYAGRGRHKMEEQHPVLAEEIRTLVELHNQADPKFKMSASSYFSVAAHVGASSR